MKKCSKCDFESDSVDVCPNCNIELAESPQPNTVEVVSNKIPVEKEQETPLAPPAGDPIEPDLPNPTGNPVNPEFPEPTGNPIQPECPEPTGSPVKLESPEKSPSANPKQSNKIIIIIIVAAVIAVVVLICLVGSYSNTNSSTSSSNSTSSTSSQTSSSTSASQADKDELKATIDKYSKEVNASDYTTSSFSTLSDALTKGQTVYDNESATQYQVQSAISAINSAYNQLVAKTKPVTFTGSGDDVIDVPSDLSTAIVTAKNEGSSNFVVWARDSSMDGVDLLVNTIGSYEGTTMIGTRSATVSYLEINSNGKWSITLSPLDDAPSATNGGSYKGDQVLLLSASDAQKLKFTNSGKSNFAVKGITQSGSIDLLVNEIGDYSGTVVNKNYSMLIVESSGTWSVSW